MSKYLTDRTALVKAFATAAMAAGLLLSASPLQAALSASTAVSDVKWTVIDLTPSDGNAAGYVPITMSYLREVTTVVSVAPDSQDYQSTADASVELDSRREFGANWSMAHAGPAPYDGMVAAFADDTLPRHELVYANMDSMIYFTLLPQTRLEVSGRVSWADLQQGDNNPMWIKAQSGFTAGELEGNYPDPPIRFSLYRSITKDGADDSGFQDFTVVYVNDSHVARTSSFYTYAGVLIDVAPVPEPGTYAMLGSGLLLLGMVRRRYQPRLTAAEEFSPPGAGKRILRHIGCPLHLARIVLSPAGRVLSPYPFVTVQPRRRRRAGSGAASSRSLFQDQLRRNNSASGSRRDSAATGLRG